MRTLAIDCATPTASLALLDEKRTLAELYLDIGRGHTELLLPALEKLLTWTGLSLEGIDLLACTNGPGSFTGVRIGVGTIKGLALATGKPIVAVSSLEAMAMTNFPAPNLICPLLDARKNQVYAGLYRSTPEGFPEALAPDRLTDIGALAKALASEEVAFVGDAALLRQMQLPERAVQRSAPPLYCHSRINASTVGLIAQHYYRHGRIEDPLTLTPSYLRPSEAENHGAPEADGAPLFDRQEVDISIRLR